MQGQYYIVCVLKTSAMQVKIEYVLKEVVVFFFHAIAANTRW